MMKIKRLMAVAAVVMLAACGDDGGTGATPVTRAPAFNLSGRWSHYAMWLTQFNRTADGYNGSYTCSGTMTIVQDASSSSFTGFAVVGAPCAPVSFDLSGNVDRAGGVTLNMRGPRPGAGPCPQGPESRYTGLVNGGSISARGAYTVACGEEGEYQFNVILSATRSN